MTFREAAFEGSRKAVTLDGYDVGNKLRLTFAYMFKGLWEEAEVQLDTVRPQLGNDSEMKVVGGWALVCLGRHEEGRNLMLDAIRLDPGHPPLL